MNRKEKPLQEFLAAKVISHAAQAIAESRINRQAAHLHDIAEAHAITQSEVFRQVREHLAALQLQEPAFHFELIVDQDPKSRPLPKYLLQQYTELIVDQDPKSGPLPKYLLQQYLPHFNLLESATFDHQYLLQMAHSLEDPEAKLDHLSLKTILEIEERTCSERLKGAEGRVNRKLEQRLSNAKAILKQLSPNAFHHPLFSTSKPDIERLAKEVEEHRVKTVELPVRFYSLIRQVASIVRGKTKEIKLAVKESLNNQRPSGGNKPG